MGKQATIAFADDFGHISSHRLGTADDAARLNEWLEFRGLEEAGHWFVVEESPTYRTATKLPTGELL